MAFETFPIPGQNPKADEVMTRLASQGQVLQNVVAKLYQSADTQLQAQDATLGRVNAKLTRAVNGRVKQQGALAQPVVNSLSAAIDGALTQQGQQLALQSAVLSRLAPQPAPVLSDPTALATNSPAGITPGGVRGGAPATTNGPSLPPGVAAPVSTVGPSDVVPPAAAGGTATFHGPITQPAMGPGTVSAWMVLVDCAAQEVVMLRCDDPQFTSLIANGHYVPIRYDHDPLLFPQPEAGSLELAQGWMGDNESRHAEWVSIACHAYNNNGDKWPANGDFPHDPPVTTTWNGIPVGSWPFDSSGNYVGA